MDEFYNPNQTKDLHEVAPLQEIEIRPGLTIRPLVENDAPRILAILDADPEIRNRVSVASRLHEVEDVSKEIDEIKKDPGLIRYAILDGENPIGLVSLWRDDGFFGTPPNPDDYGFGYFLDPNERGKGIVTDTVKALMDAAQQNLDVRQFVAFCEADNEESTAVLTKLGFEANGETFTEPTHNWTEYKYVRPAVTFEKQAELQRAEQ